MKEPARYPYYVKTSLSCKYFTWWYMGGTDGSFPGVGLHAAQALCEGTIAPGRACPIVHASFSRKFMYLVVEGAIPKYLGWWLDNISTSLGHVNHEKEIVQWMGPSLTSAVLQEMRQLKYLRRNTSPPLSIHLSNTCSSFSFRSILAATPVRYYNASTGNR